MDNREIGAVTCTKTKETLIHAEETGHEKCPKDHSRHGMIRRSAADTKGELLIEALVSFVILLIVLTGVTAIVLTSTNMNKEAEVNSKELEKAISEVETSGGAGSGTDGKLIVTFPDETIGIDVTVKTRDSITFFSPTSGGN